nr:glycosyltransferase [uncultured Ruegeria sp.]
MSKRLAIISSGLTGPLNGAVQFANEARSIGCDVCLFAPKSSSELISHFDLEHYEIPTPRVDAFAPLLSPEQRRALTAEDRLNAAINALGVNDFAASIAAFQPDVIFVDCELHAHIIVGLSLGLPIIQFSNMFLSPPGPRAPPLNKRTCPGVGVRGSRIGVSIIWINFLLWKFKKALRLKSKHEGADFLTALLELARRYNVPIARKVRLICWQMPWTYKIPTVLFLPHSVDLPTHLYPDFEYFGAMVLQDRPEKPYDNELVCRFCSARGAEKRIFIGFGTVMKPKFDLLANLWEVASKHPEWRFLFAAGQNWEDGSSCYYPPNVDVVAWVPQHQILKHTHLAIMHGGTGGLIEAVEAATPVLLYPHVNDQQGSAARAVFHGIGRAGRHTDTVEKIETDIQELLTDPKYKKNCKAMQAACQQEKVDGGLADFLQIVTN